MKPVVGGSTDQSIIVRVIDSTSGLPETGVAYDTPGVDLWYRREGGVEVNIAEVSLAAADSAHADGGFIHIADGYCRLDLPDAAVAAGVNGVMVGGTFTDMIVIGCYTPVIVADLYGVPVVDAEDSVCDAVLTGAAHNDVNSLGRRIRELGAFAIEAGTAQAGTATSVTIAATANGGDDVFNRNLIVLTDNTGKGQSRAIAGYDSTTKICLVDHDWEVIPDNTTAYQIIPGNTPLVTDHGQAQGGTSTTLTLHAQASSVDNLYKNGILTIAGGTGAGQIGLITAYNGTTKVVTIASPEWVVVPDATSIYGISPYGVTSVSDINTDALALINIEATDAVLDEIVEGGYTMRQLLRGFISVLAGNSAGGGTTTLTFQDIADSKARITATVDINGNRTNMVLDLS